MSILSEGASISCPHLLDEINYPYWKTRIKVFIRALDVRAQRSILTGWTPPTVTNSEGKKSIKPEVDQSNNDDRLANYNKKALHTLFNGCDVEHTKLISSCEIAKEVWEILQTTFEGSSDVKRINFYLLLLNLKNKECTNMKTLSNICTKLYDITNEFLALGERIPKTQENCEISS